MAKSFSEFLAEQKERSPGLKEKVNIATAGTTFYLNHIKEKASCLPISKADSSFSDTSAAIYYLLGSFDDCTFDDLPLTYNPNQAAPAPTTTDTKPACALLGFSSAINHCIVL